MKIAGRILDYIYPINAVCTGCGDRTGADSDGLCSACHVQLDRLRIYSRDGRCPLCLAPVTALTCRNCELLAGWVSRAAFAFAYHEPAARIVRRYKYHSEGYMAGWMARQMLDAPGADELLARTDLLVCAPTDILRKSRRGYNQAYLLAKEISGLTGIPTRDLLRRRPFVRHQARLDRKRRLANLTDVIFCREDLQGKRILLIDDVRTTGATAAACARALKAAGATEVMLLTFAASD